MKTIQLNYFAVMRDFSQCGEETLLTQAKTVRDLYQELVQKYDISLAQSSLKVAVNDQFSHWDHPLSDGDQVVFIPPVAGG